METLRPIASPLNGLLPVQQVREGEQYRLLHYVVQQEVEEGVLLYNVLTKAVALLSPEEAERMGDDPAKVPELVAGWFAVPVPHDDCRLAQEVRTVGKMLRNPSHGYRTFTVFTTTDCNARCFYCYEKGRARIPMKEETARKVAEWILGHKIPGEIRLRWFGGEPLYNRPAITTICTALKEAGVEYRSSMTSNGYLFDDAIVEEAVGLWNLKKVQITLDGTEEVYNRSKAFIYQDESPYRRVLANIRRLLDAGIRVSVRLNVGPHNAEDLLALADELGGIFPAEENLKVYSHALFDTEETRPEEMAAARMRLERKLREKGLSKPGRLPKDLRLNHCMSDDSSSVTILPDGHLGKCEHYSESGWFGNIGSEEKNEAVLERFRAVREELAECAGCPLYPDCIRLVVCDETAVCRPEMRAERLEILRNNLQSWYLKRKSDEVSD